MIREKAYIIIGICLTIILTIAASAFAIYNNYNSENVNGFTPGNAIDAYNQYQIDGEAANAFGGPPGVGPVQNGNMQNWTETTWPYRVVPFNPTDPNCIYLPAFGGWARWNLNGPFSNPPDNYPEVKWGVYRVHLVLVTRVPGGKEYGPLAPTNIDIEIDGVWQFSGQVQSGVNANMQTVYNDIWLDFHLNVGQGNANTWLGQWWWNNQEHWIAIDNWGPNDLYLDEFHLSTA